MKMIENNRVNQLKCKIIKEQSSTSLEDRVNDFYTECVHNNSKIESVLFSLASNQYGNTYIAFINYYKFYSEE